MKTALIIIDLQNDFLAQLPAGRADDVVEGACQLVEAARAAGAPVIWVVQRFRADLSDAFLEMRDRQIATVIEGTRGAELANGLVPLLFGLVGPFSFLGGLDKLSLIIFDFLGRDRKVQNGVS